MLEKNCADGHPESCKHAGYNYMRGDADDEIEHLGRALDACEKGDSRACFVAGATAKHADDPTTEQQRIDWLERACRDDIPAACERWIWALDEGLEPPGARFRAARSVCDLGYSAGCLELGALMLDGTEHRDEGVERLRSVCPTSNARCVDLIEELVERGELVEALELAEALCRLSVDGACATWAELPQGDDGDAPRPAHSNPQSRPRPRTLRLIECEEASEEPGCSLSPEFAAELRAGCSDTKPFVCAAYARAMELGIGPEASATEYRDAISKACRGGFWKACVLHASRLRYTPSARDQYERLRAKACEHQIQDACFEELDSLYRDFLDSRDPSPIIEALEGQCDQGSTAACFELRGWYAYQLEIWSPPEGVWHLSGVYGRRACEEGDGSGCSVAALARLVQTSPAALTTSEADKIDRWFARACRLGFRNGCLQHGLFYIWGPPSRDKERGFEILEGYCKGDQPWLCRRLIQFYRNGTYGEAQPDRADTIEKALCKAGDEDACDSLGITEGRQQSRDPG